MRCPNCMKFVSFEENEPETQDVELSDTSLSLEVRIVNVCADCGQELKEATIELSADLSPEATDHLDSTKGHELSAELESCDRTSRQDGKPGTPSRYRHTFYGAEAEVMVTCSCGDYSEHTIMSNDVAASAMDELT